MSTQRHDDLPPELRPARRPHLAPEELPLEQPRDFPRPPQKDGGEDDVRLPDPFLRQS